MPSHIRVLRVIFAAHHKHGIVLRARKTKLLQKKVDFQGFSESGNRIEMEEQYLEQIVALRCKRPATPEELLSRLGFLSYYSQFVPRFAELTSSLTLWKNKRYLIWSEEMKKDWLELVDKFAKANRRHLLRVDPNIT